MRRPDWFYWTLTGCAFAEFALHFSNFLALVHLASDLSEMAWALPPNHTDVAFPWSYWDMDWDWTSQVSLCIRGRTCLPVVRLKWGSQSTRGKSRSLISFLKDRRSSESRYYTSDYD
jgi:hypothetical protein